MRIPFEPSAEAGPRQVPRRRDPRGD
jgi:hypothetical protein